MTDSEGLSVCLLWIFVLAGVVCAYVAAVDLWLRDD